MPAGNLLHAGVEAAKSPGVVGLAGRETSPEKNHKMQILELDPEMTVESLRGAPVLNGASPKVRATGLHVSDIIRHIENTITKPGKRPNISTLTEEERRRMGRYVEVGWMWEDVIRSAMVRTYYAGVTRFEDPGELESDGIYGNPDWFDTEDWCVEEFKATYRSSRRPISSDFWSWFVQIKAYCHMTGTRHARLRVFFVNGDYRASGPQFKLWQLTFEHKEIESNWAMIVREGDKCAGRKE